MTEPRPHQATAAPRPVAIEDGDLRLSVWPTAQRDARSQRAGRYLPAATAHPGKMLPAIAAIAISRYTEPGDLVADPMCGIGTTLIEAVHLGRDALGVEYEPRWAALAAQGIDLAKRHGAAGDGEVVCGDARRLPAIAPARARGRVALIVTSPPYGPSVHGHVRATAGGVRKYNNRYSRDPVNLAHHGLDALLDGITRILAGCASLLRPGGIVVITARPWRHCGELVDLPSAVIAAGLTPVERCVALLAGLGGDHLVARPSFFQLDNTRKTRARGEPWHLIVHEDVLAFRAPLSSGSPKPAQLETRQITSVPAAAEPELTCPHEKSADAAGPGRKASRARAPSASAVRGRSAPTAAARAPQPRAQPEWVSAAANPSSACNRRRAA
jgi:SAM-dependent methyltransferase